MSDLPISAVRTCRRTEPVDYVFYYGVHLFGKFFDEISKAETKRIPERNQELIRKAEFGKFICDLAKIAVNWNLCNPIGINE